MQHSTTNFLSLLLLFSGLHIISCQDVTLDNDDAQVLHHNYEISSEINYDDYNANTNNNNIYDYDYVTPAEIEDPTYPWAIDPLYRDSENSAANKHTNSSRVNGGQMATKIVPYQVSLQINRRGKYSHFCGGSIVSPHHVVTAAHCVQKLRSRDISIVCNTLNWKSGGDRHHVVKTHVHPGFSLSPIIINDIAVITVTPPFKLNRRSIATISLGNTNRIGSNIPVRLSGWGSTAPTAANGLPDKLQLLEYHTITNEECSRRGFRITKNELCALGQTGKGACVGDSGGPLVTTQTIPQLVGIVSYGTSQCAQGKPDVYTRVSSFLPYINKVITSEIP